MKNGFTLMEIIFSILIVSFFATILVNLTDTNVKRSGEVLNMVQDGFSFTEIMEKITADYKKLLKNKKDDVSTKPLVTLKNYVEKGNVEGNTSYYGAYTFETRYIFFDGNNKEAPDPPEDNTLKIKIFYKNQSVTALFTDENI